MYTLGPAYFHVYTVTFIWYTCCMYSPSFSPSRSLSLTTLPFSSTLSLRFLFSLSLSSNPFLYFLSSPPPL